ncbi:hypothetical protein AAF712_012025 [Marasmius tenuissimus]|uniref:Uncharacterized protein n=1 Tax=Marasmius tenuissimus TaxID=585030 RepID=A0ABR2ZHN3_9AGAR
MVPHISFAWLAVMAIEVDNDADWEIVFSDASTETLGARERFRPAIPRSSQILEAEEEKAKDEEVLPIVVRQEQFIDLGLWHTKRLTLELEKKELELAALRAEISRLQRKTQTSNEMDETRQ